MAQTYNKSKVKIVIYTVSLLLMVSMLASAILASIAAHFPDAAMGTVQLILTMPALIAIASSLAAGPLSTRIPKKILILIGISSMAFGGIVSFLLGQVSIALLILAAGFIGVGQGALITLTSSLIAEYFEGDECRQILGKQSACVNGGSVVFVFIASELARFGWNKSYLVYLALIPVLFVVLALLPGRGPSEQNLGSRAGTSKLQIRLGLRVLYLCGVLFLFTTFMYVYLLNVSGFVVGSGLGDVKMAGYANTTMTLAGFLGGIFYQRIHAIFRNFIFTVGIVAAGFGLLVLYLAGNLFSVFFAAICCGVGLTLMMPSSIFSAASSVDAASSSTAIAVVGATSSLAMFLSGIILKPVVESMGGEIRTYFIVGAVGLLILGVVALGEAFWQNSKNTLRR